MKKFLIISIVFLFGALLLIHIVYETFVVPEKLLTRYKIEPGESRKALIVLLHGFRGNGESLKHVRQILENIGDVNLPQDATDLLKDKPALLKDVIDQLKDVATQLKGADVLIPNMPFGRFSMARPSHITAELIKAIDDAWKQRRYDRIVLIGHSMGGLYARKVYAVACGENKEAPFEKSLKDSLKDLGADPIEHNPRSWATAVERIILLAGMNRGWSISHHMSIPLAVTMKIGMMAGHVLKWIHGETPIIFTVRRGSPFLTQLRLQWLAMKKEHVKLLEGKTVGGAVTAQLLGTIDDLVSPKDNIDLISGKDFKYLEVPMSGHLDVVDMDNTTAGKERRKALLLAFSDHDALKPLNVDPSDSLINGDPEVEVTDVVFVIHGIRDEGYWTKKIANRAKKLGENPQLMKGPEKDVREDQRGERKVERNRVFKDVTSSYGYFPVLSFLWPGARQEKVEWLMERYTEAKATYPKAKFHFVGHSHGTYLLTKALKDYPSISFKHVVFAGSVVRTDYEWKNYIKQPKGCGPSEKKPDCRITSVVNFVANADWVVAFFPKAFESIDIQDLGSAGHDGFNKKLNRNLPVIAYKYVPGGHSAALKEAMWDSIAKFIVTGRFGPPKDPNEKQSSPDQEKGTTYLEYVTPLIGMVIVGLLVWLLFLPRNYQTLVWKKTMLILGFLVVIWIIIILQEAPDKKLTAPDHEWWVYYPAKVAPLIWAGILGVVGRILYLLYNSQIREWKKTTYIIIFCAAILLILTEV